jgi:hypothetical protein
VNDFEVFHVHGKQKSNERKDTISKFRSAKKSIITNAKCLTEGIDVPAVDMVAFVDPRHSKIDIAQAVGRAMRKPRGGDKDVGYIVVPIYAEDASEQSIELAIRNENFDDVALILNALQEQDVELVDVIRELKEAKGRGEVFNPRGLQDKIEVIGPHLGINDLTNSIYVEIVNSLGEVWDEWFGLLEKFQAREKHCLVQRDHLEDGHNLGQWCNTQRTRRQQLTEDRVRRLEELGFIWDPRVYQWEQGFSALKKYKEREGHCRVFKDHIEADFPLGTWTHGLRNKNRTLTPERHKRLSELGFIWDVNSHQWEEGFYYLTQFKHREGHCFVKNNHIEDGFNLGVWVSGQLY